ncbi:hypothetical protein COP2_018946 [Malus domestica]
MLFLVLWGLVYRYTVHARQLKGKFVLHKKSGFYIGQLMDLSALLKYFQTSLFHDNLIIISVVLGCPMYYHMKFAFLVWLQLPTVDGAKQLYTNHLRPFFLKHQAIIDRVLVLTYSKVHKLLSAHKAEIEYARAMVMKMLGSDQPSNSDLPRHNAIEGQIRPPNPDLPGQNAVEDQTRLDQYQFRSLIMRISIITKRRIVIAFRM